MALRATSALVPDPSSTTRPVNRNFTFTVEVVDRRAARATKHTLELSLAASNDLMFSGGTKTVTQEETIGSVPVTVTFSSKRIAGGGDDLSSFRVTLREQGGSDLVFCLVGIE